MSNTEELPPIYDKLDSALRSIGYDFEIAIADLIDNSIDADAENILLRIIVDHDKLHLVILDDGIGMNPHTLKEAMRFGSDTNNDESRLGKFGLGLKLASLSQAKAIHVITSQNGLISGRAWLEDGIQKGFRNTVYNQTECTEFANKYLPAENLNKNGTLLVLYNLYRTGQYTNIQEHAQKLIKNVANYLSLAFHRFLSGKAGNIKISIDMMDAHTRKSGIPVNLEPLDPFGYRSSGQKQFPQIMNIEGEYKTSVKIKAHIWPANSNAAEYKLPGGSNSRQGFYFYRNNRLIQGGGWNGIREAEPHSSLSRIEVDLDPALDLDINLDVKKSIITLPPNLKSSIQKAKTDTGIDFKKYLSLSEDAYRKRVTANSELPLIPSKGLPVKLVNMLQRELKISSTDLFRELHFCWAALDDDQFFDVDRDAGCINLNRKYRQAVLKGFNGSATDAPLLKCLLFFILEEAVTTGRMSSRIKMQMEKVNRILVEAVKHEKY